MDLSLTSLTPATKPVERLHALDAARGLAALAVVVWHWQHMYLIGGGKLDDRTIQPFYALLFPLYQAGWLAVEFFFTLSGFVFFWLYGKAIRDRQIGVRSFFVPRFSRLYPLHFVVLLVVAALQILLITRGFDSFVYGGTTLPNFLLNLAFLQFFIKGWTFNGPEWSVGVEVLLYALFFLYCRLVNPAKILPLLLSVAIGTFVLFHDWAAGRGLIGFFAGGLVYQAWIWFRADQARLRWSVPILCFTAALWVFSFAELQFHVATALIDSLGQRGWWVMEMAFRFLLVPLSVLALALAEPLAPRLWQRISPLGDLTYGLYLLHFPLQLLVATVITLFGLPTAPASGPFAFIAYFAVLIGLSALSYHYFERPAQRALRKMLSKPSAQSAKATFDR